MQVGLRKRVVDEEDEWIGRGDWRIWLMDGCEWPID